ncbi:MAG: TolC family protein [Prevotella sp.]|nr:TolC family protein [Prevotella sp.]
MRRIYIILFAIIAAANVSAQRTLTLEECRQLAVEGNKKLSIAKAKSDISTNITEAAKTLSLPRVNAILGYEHFGKEMSLLNSSQKKTLSNLGTSAGAGLSTGVTDLLTDLAMRGLITPQQAQGIGSQLGETMQGVTDGLNTVGNNIKEGFRTDTRNIFAGTIMVSQPIYLGGAITAAKEMAAITHRISETTYENSRQTALYEVDNSYWLVVQLAHKKKLADRYTELVRKLNDDMQKCINEGVATRAEGLKVAVALNEAEMTQMKVDDGIRLAKMLLCQQCGLPIESDITVADENTDNISEKVSADIVATTTNTTDFYNRPELQLLQHAADLSKQTQNLIKAANRPQILATGGVLVSNPTLYNGFEKKFGVDWTVGIMARIPIWDWKETEYKLNAARAATNIAELELQDATELIELQVAQNKFKISEAQRKISFAKKNIEKAEENLRCANLGFSEGVMTSTEVMAAQTAWMQAETQRIDAEIELVMAQTSLKKNLGRM